MSLSAAIRSRVPQKVAPPPPGFPRARVPKPKIQKPIWAMTDAELLAVARGQAQAAYKPQIDALERQRKDTVNANQAAQAGLAKLLEALQAGTSGYSDEIANIFRDAQRQVNAYASDKGSNLDVVNRMYEGEGSAYAGAGKAQAGLIGNEGQLRYLAAVQEQNKQLSEIGADIAEVQGKIPGATQQALGDLYDARDDYAKAQVAQQKFEFQQYQFQYKRAQDQAKQLSDSGWLYIVVDTPQGPAVKLVKDKKGNPVSTNGMTPYQKASLAARATASANLQAQRQVQNDLAQQRIDASKQKKGKTLTPNQINSLVQGWYTGKATTVTRKVGVDKNGNPVYRRAPAGRTGQLDYQRAYRRLRSLGVPDQQAREALNTAYKRGERGRPWLSASQRAVLKKAKLYPNAGYLSKRQGDAILEQLPDDTDIEAIGTAFLTPNQVQALQVAGLLPDGIWAPGGGVKDKRGFSLTRIYLISPGY